MSNENTVVMGCKTYTIVKTYDTANPQTEAFRFSIGLSERGYKSTVNPTEYGYIVLETTMLQAVKFKQI